MSDRQARRDAGPSTGTFALSEGRHDRGDPMRTRSQSRFMPTSVSMVAGALLAAACLVSIPAASPALAVPAGFTDSLIATLTQPTAVKVLPGGDLLVLEKQGAFRARRRQRCDQRRGDDRRLLGERRAGPAQRGARSCVRDDRHDLRLRDAAACRCLRQHAVEVHDERRGRGARLRGGARSTTLRG